MVSAIDAVVALLIVGDSMVIGGVGAGALLRQEAMKAWLSGGAVVLGGGLLGYTGIPDHDDDHAGAGG